MEMNCFTARIYFGSGSYIKKTVIATTTPIAASKRERNDYRKQKPQNFT